MYFQVYEKDKKFKAIVIVIKKNAFIFKKIYQIAILIISEIWRMLLKNKERRDKKQTVELEQLTHSLIKTKHSIEIFLKQICLFNMHIKMSEQYIIYRAFNIFQEY